MAAMASQNIVAAANEICGWIPLATNILGFPQEPIPYACVNPPTDCISSGSYMGCGNPIPTTCVQTAKAKRGCEPGQLCCGPYPNTDCWTWHSIDNTATYTLLQCSSVSGIGTLMANSIPPDGTLTVTTKNGSPRTSDDAKTTSTAEVSTPTAGVTIPTKTSLLLPGIPSETSGSSGEASPAAITGAIVGALAFLGILLGVTVFIWNRARKKKRLAHETSIGGPVTPLRKRDSMIPFHAGAINVPVSSVYDYGGPSNRVSRGDSGVPEGANKPPRPPRSPTRDMNVTEGGWI
ncbi:hypothetical protein BDP81DRAFT_450263 [Colletotrichum phormii]|uniref:Uncharacterized protein n=1 Tax=Colletotrichum phormii TaxID=359342 RepID=A0AAI9ZR68_9PEZI|nr:uncharacterized protein BDP81DRAFT_450263 [Colletotrichum phormii]KAK1636366.1 hypothetical protein BDP81DRAFT_450263 [Colletotrichum phormii]